MDSSGIFDVLPVEVIRIVFCFCDVPSLGNIAQTGHNALSTFASDDITWAMLVERRFRIVTKKSSPRLNGGHSWKHAYYSMAISDRIPKAGRYTSSQKIVFAKGRSNQKKVNGSISLWVLIGHTENCKTRTVRQCERAQDADHGSNERYVELYLCLQNVKSGGGEVTADILESTLVLMGNSESFDPLVSRVCKSDLFLRPKVLFHDTMEASPATKSAADYPYCDISNGVTLRPFDVVVVSVHFPCATDIFETDFLARAVSLHVPVRKPGMTVNETSEVTAVASPSATMQDTEVGARSAMTLFPPHASAFFIPENAVWNYYMELPGGFLTLVDRFQMFTV